MSASSGKVSASPAVASFCKLSALQLRRVLPPAECSPPRAGPGAGPPRAVICLLSFDFFTRNTSVPSSSASTDSFAFPRRAARELKTGMSTSALPVSPDPLDDDRRLARAPGRLAANAFRAPFADCFTAFGGLSARSELPDLDLHVTRLAGTGFPRLANSPVAM